MQIYNLLCNQQTRKGYFCRVFRNCLVVNHLQRLNIGARVILYATPSLECVKRKLHRHNCIVNVVAVVHLAMDVYVFNLLQVVLLKLRHHFFGCQLLCLHTGSPMLGSVEGIEAWYFTYYDLVGQLSGIR